MSRCPDCGVIGVRTEGKIVIGGASEYRCRGSDCRTVVFTDHPASECSRQGGGE